MSAAPRTVPAYASAGVEASEGAGGRTVLFLHGIGGSRHSFDEQLAAVPDGWCAVAWDAPGYGDSAPLASMTFETLANAAVAVLDDVGAGQAVIVGHSMGGMVAQEIAARYPSRVRGLVLYATSAAFGGRDDTFKNKFLADRLKPLDEGLAPADFADRLVGQMFGPRTPAALKETAIRSMSSVPSATYRQALTCIVAFDRKAALADIACPTLVLAAENDSLAPPKTMERMAAAIPAARYVCLPDAGHLANMEDAAAFNAAVNDFLTSLEID